MSQLDRLTPVKRTEIKGRPYSVPTEHASLQTASEYVTAGEKRRRAEIGKFHVRVIE